MEDKIMNIKAMLTLSVSAFLLTACATMDTQNKAKVAPEMSHTHPENCKYFAVTHTHGAALGGTDPATHNHGRGC